MSVWRPGLRLRTGSCSLWLGLILLPALTGLSVAASPQEAPATAPGRCYDTDQVIGVCAGGLSKTTYRQVTVTLNSVRHETQTKVVGALVDVLAKDPQSQKIPVLQLLDGYFKCVSEMVGISQLLTGTALATNTPAANTPAPAPTTPAPTTPTPAPTSPAPAPTPDDAALAASQQVLQQRIAATAAATQSAIKQTFGEVAIVPEKIRQMNSLDMAGSLAASQALQALPKAAPGSKTRLELFSKSSQLDPSFAHEKLFQIFRDQGFVIDDATLSTVAAQSARQLELVRKSPVNRWHKVNALWFSSSQTPLPHVKAAALVLMAAGAELYSIQPFCPKSPRFNKDLIQVGAFPGVRRQQPYTAAEVLAAGMDSFARLDPCH